jgi:predicted transcriptional regulator of viral defense system
VRGGGAISSIPDGVRGVRSTFWSSGVRFVDRGRVTAIEIDEMVAGESAVLAVAARQHGVISQAQLAAAGLGRGWVRHRVARGWLRRLHRGVYLVGPLVAEHSRAMAAVLAAGPEAVVSHHPAAVLWDWRPPREGPMHVIAGGRSQAGVIVHHTALDPRDRTRRHGIPVTSAARTILDLAAAADQLERALNEAMLQRRVSLRSLNEQFSRYPRHRGTAALRRLLESEPTLTRSDAEILARSDPQSRPARARIQRPHRRPRSRPPLARAEPDRRD